VEVIGFKLAGILSLRVKPNLPISIRSEVK